MKRFAIDERLYPVLLPVLVLSIVVSSSPVSAQGTQVPLAYTRGQNISPAYEGWVANEDGSFSFLFGYMNRNWEEELHIPVGPHNTFSGGIPDRGQPTHFQPRRNRFTFEVRVPADFGDQELVWTLTSNGVTEHAYASLRPDYVLDNVAIASETGALGAGTSSPETRANVAPTIELEGGRNRTAKVGERVELVARITDDGVPELPASIKRAQSQTPEQALARAMRPPRRITVGKIVGLHFGWHLYRGSGPLSFDPPQIKSWEDTRAAANSPWAALWVPPPIPEGDRWTTFVVFHEPGTYVLRGRADDGALYADEQVTFTVTN